MKTLRFAAIDEKWHLGRARLKAFRRSSGIGPGDLFRWGIRFMPAMALFALALTDDPLLQWLSLLGVAPLALALLPGVPGGCAACRAGRAGQGVLPPAH